eukprot:5914409-Pyramimonas_sp.AAC.1
MRGACCDDVMWAGRRGWTRSRAGSIEDDAEDDEEEGAEGESVNKSGKLNTLGDEIEDGIMGSGGRLALVDTAVASHLSGSKSAEPPVTVTVTLAGLADDQGGSFVRTELRVDDPATPTNTNVAPADVSLEDEATMYYNSMAESPLASFPAASSLD